MIVVCRLRALLCKVHSQLITIPEQHVHCWIISNCFFYFILFSSHALFCISCLKENEGLCQIKEILVSDGIPLLQDACGCVEIFCSILVSREMPTAVHPLLHLLFHILKETKVLQKTDHT